MMISRLQTKSCNFFRRKPLGRCRRWVDEKFTKKKRSSLEDDGFSGSRQEEESSYVEFYGGPTQRKTQKREDEVVPKDNWVFSS